VAKGIRGYVVRNHMTFENHKRCPFKDENAEDVLDDDVTLKDDEMKRRARLMGRSVINTIHEYATAATAANIVDGKFVVTPLPSYTLYTPCRENVSIRSFKHCVKTIKTMKMTLIVSIANGLLTKIGYARARTVITHYVRDIIFSYRCK